MTAMPPDHPEQLVRDLFDALNGRDLERAVSLYGPQAIVSFGAGSASGPSQQSANRAPVPPTIELIGQAQISNYYGWLLFERWPDTNFRLDELDVSGGVTVRAPWHLQTTDGAPVVDGAELFGIREGRLVHHSSQFEPPPEGLGQPSAAGGAEDAEDNDDDPDRPQQNVIRPKARTKRADGARDADPPQQQTAVEAHPPAAETAPAPAAWPAGKCLIGVGGAAYEASPSLLPGDLQAIRQGRVEAVWLPMTAGPEQVAALRGANPDIFILVGLFRDLRPPGESPEAYLNAVAPFIEPLYQAGVRYYEVQGVFRTASDLDIWQALIGSLQTFSAWFIAVHALLKARFPEAHFGLPAVRLPADPSWATDNQLFLAEADPAARAADWISVPGPWSGAATDGGPVYQNYRARYPDKLLFITDVVPLNIYTSVEARAEEYVGYFRALRSLPNLGAAFANVSLGAPSNDPQSWLTTDGVPTALSQILGARRWGEPGDPPENFAGFATNDRPEGKDELGYDDYARAFVRVLSNPDTKTPLTIGIYGSWGMGKSFLMKRIRSFVEEVQRKNERARRDRPLSVRAWEAVKRLRPLRRPPPAAAAPASPRRRALAWLGEVFTRPASREVDFHCVEFNAWVYSGSENLWAGLITHLYNEVEKFLGTRRTVPFRFSHNAQRAARKAIWLLVLYGLIGFALSVLLDLEQIQAAVEAVGAQAATIAGVVALGGTLAAALAALPPLLAALRDLANSLTLARSEQLAALASRRDFRDKIGFMADIKDEIRMIRRLLDQGKDGLRTRLVIFIDDLDRCEPKKAVEVLEAIMLLLADEDGMPFVVVLGIDARIVVKAVEERYGKVLTEAGISGYEYLDKIVQIPFRIPPPPSSALANYVTSLLWRNSEERQAYEAQAAEAQRLEKLRAEEAAGLRPKLPTWDEFNALAAQQQRAAQDDGRTAEAATSQRAPDQARELPPGAGRPAPVVPPPTWTPPPAPEVTFLPDERQAFEAYAKDDHLSPNPRRVKRILNIYRVVRLLKPDTTPAQRQQMIKWVVLTEQWPYRTAWLMQAAEDDAQLPAPQRRLQDGDTLATLYQHVLADVRAKDAQPFASLDADPDLFDGFINAAPPITVADLQDLRRYTFNLNPALQGEVTKAVVRKISG